MMIEKFEEYIKEEIEDEIRDASDEVKDIIDPSWIDLTIQGRNFMKIYVLSDNHAQKDFNAEWGLSFYIEFNNETILFDFGSSDLYIKNGRKLGINVFNADHYVLSHGHWDHGDGLKYMPKRKIVCHPKVFTKRYTEDRYLGLPYTYEEMEEKFDLILTKEPYKLNEKTIFLGEIPRTNDFESKNTQFIKKDGTLDFVEDDSSIVFITNKGLVIISGCAHAGICNTIEYAKRVTKIDKIYAVLGGFHLKGEDEITQKTIEYLNDLNIKYLRPSHCTQFPALVQFANTFGSKPFGVGEVIEL